MIDTRQTAGTIEASLGLRVHDAMQIAEDIFSFDLRRADGGELTPFTAGAHVGVEVPGIGIRKYSLCNDPAERHHYVIAVKREAAGRGGSRTLIAAVKAGHDLHVSAPRNNFELSPRAPGFVFIAGGIGITPIMAMMRALAASERTFKLYYCTRSPEATAFLDELGAPEMRRRVTIHHDGGDPERALDLWPILEQPSNAHIYCCGPRSMMESVRDMTGHWPSSAVHFESFADAAARATPEDKPFTVRLTQSGAAVEVPVGVSILEALRRSGFDAPSSCESGTCGTCRTRLISGEADHRDLVLTEDERAHQIMLCVSRARSAELVIDR